LFVTINFNQSRNGEGHQDTIWVIFTKIISFKIS